MIASTVFNEMISVLQTDASLAAYMKYVFKGMRFNLEPDALPCICVEPIQNNEIVNDMNQIKNVRLNFDVIAFSYCPTDSDKTIVGDANYKGILDIENDIRKALTDNNTLNDNVIDLSMDTTTFDIETVEKKYYTRAVVIPVSVLYRQVDVT